MLFRAVVKFCGTNILFTSLFHFLYEVYDNSPLFQRNFLELTKYYENAVRSRRKCLSLISFKL